MPCDARGIVRREFFLAFCAARGVVRREVFERLGRRFRGLQSFVIFGDAFYRSQKDSKVYDGRHSERHRAQIPPQIVMAHGPDV